MPVQEEMSGERKSSWPQWAGLKDRDTHLRLMQEHEQDRVVCVWGGGVGSFVTIFIRHQFKRERVADGQEL